MDDEWLLNSAIETSGKHLHTFPLLENERVYESASRKKHPASRPKLRETTAPCDRKYAAHIKSEAGRSMNWEGNWSNWLVHNFLVMSRTVWCGSLHQSRKTTKVL